MKHNKNIMVGGGTQLAKEGPKIAASLVKYSIASVISLLFYIPTYLLNVPDNTLENLLPDGSCKFLFNKFSEGSKKAANKLKTIIDTNFSDSISNRFLKNGKRINEKLYIGNEKENENNVNKNCINKQNKTLCNLRKNEISYGTDNYENGFIYKALYGRSNTKERSKEMKRRLVKKESKKLK